MRQALLFCIALTASLPALAQSTTILSGIPSMKISEGGIQRTPETVPRDRGLNLGCVISRIGEKYYWATRENKELVRIHAGAFTTFIATDGSGYVRIVDAEAKSAAALMSDTESKFDYVEHLLIGLRSVTYYGKTRDK